MGKEVAKSMQCFCLNDENKIDNITQNRLTNFTERRCCGVPN